MKSKKTPRKPAPKRRKAAAGRKAPARAAQRAPARKKRLHAAIAPSKTPVARITAEQQIVGALFLGKVINYFSHLAVAILVLEAPLAVGDTVRIKGHTTDLTQRIDSLQVAHQSVQSASAGEGVGIHVADRVRTGDAVYKV